MSGTKNAPKVTPAKKRLSAAEKLAAELAEIVSVSEEGFTGYDSHGSRYLRVTMPRDWAAQYESAMNRFSCSITKGGVITLTPLRDLIAVTPKVAKGAKAVEDSAV